MRYKNNKNYLTFLRFQFVYISVWLWYWHVRQPYVSSTFEGRQDQNQDVVWYTLRSFRVEYLQEHFRYTWLLCNQLQLLAAVALAQILKDNTAAVSTGTPITIKVARIIQNNTFCSDSKQLSSYITAITPPNKQVLDYLHKLLLRSSHDHTTNLPTLTKNPLELILQVFKSCSSLFVSSTSSSYFFSYSS